MGWDKIPAGYIEIRPGVYERIENKQRAILGNEGASRPRKPERTVLNEPVGEDEGKKAHTGRIHVRFIARRKRLTDPDNNICKYLLDCARLSGIISNDTEKDVSIETCQEKTKGKEETIIEFYHYEPSAV